MNRVGDLSWGVTCVTGRGQIISSLSVEVDQEGRQQGEGPLAEPGLRSITQGCGLCPESHGEPKTDALVGGPEDLVDKAAPSLGEGPQDPKGILRSSFSKMAALQPPDSA